MTTAPPGSAPRVTTTQSAPAASSARRAYSGEPPSRRLSPPSAPTTVSITVWPTRPIFTARARPPRAARAGRRRRQCTAGVPHCQRDHVLAALEADQHRRAAVPRGVDGRLTGDLEDGRIALDVGLPA